MPITGETMTMANRDSLAPQRAEGEGWNRKSVLLSAPPRPREIPPAYFVPLLSSVAFAEEDAADNSDSHPP